MSNPASRLYQLLKKGRDQERNKPAIEVWANLLEVDRTDFPAVWNQVGSVMQLLQEIREKVHRSNFSEPEFALQWTKKVDSAFKVSAPQSSWSGFIDQIDETTLYSLELCAKILEASSPDPSCDEAELRRLQSKATALAEALTKSNLPGDLKAYLLEQLDRVISALRTSRIFGVQRVKEAVVSSMAAMSISPEKLSEAAKQPMGKEVIELIKNLAAVVGLTNGVISIGKTLQTLIGSAGE